MEILKVENLSKSFGTKQILKNINFTINNGEVVGFVGPNGAGKTTTLKLISNLIFPDSGNIIINGYNLLKNREKALANIAAIIENPGLYKTLSGKDNLRIIQKLRKKSDEKLNSVINFIGLKSKINDNVSKYSLGMKQRLALGMCLLCEPKLLILDEPNNGLDPTGTIELRNLITKLAREEHISILFSSHLLDEVNKISDKIIFIKEGQIISIKNMKGEIIGQTYKIRVNNCKKAENLLKKAEWLNNVMIDNENFILASIKDNKLNHTINLLCKNDIEIYDINKVDSDLEAEYNFIYKEKNL